MSEIRIAANGIELACEIDEPADGPWVTLCHSEEIRAMSELVAGSTYRVVERAGHLGSWERPDAFNEHLTGFRSDGD